MTDYLSLIRHRMRERILPSLVEVKTHELDKAYIIARMRELSPYRAPTSFPDPLANMCNTPQIKQLRAIVGRGTAGGWVWIH